MRAIILGGGKIDNVNFYRSIILESDYIICADSGYDLAMQIGVKPNILLGDFDSIKSQNNGINSVKYPTRKDMTDGQIAVEYAIENGFDDIIMLGFMGGRFDHTLTNISFLDKINKANKNGLIIDEHNEIRILTQIIEIDGKCNDLVSIVPVSEVVYGVTTEGLEYPLLNENLYYNDSRGVSNVMLGDRCKISITGGKALVIKSCD